MIRALKGMQTNAAGWKGRPSQKILSSCRGWAVRWVLNSSGISEGGIGRPREFQMEASAWRRGAHGAWCI